MAKPSDANGSTQDATTISDIQKMEIFATEAKRFSDRLHDMLGRMSRAQLDERVERLSDAFSDIPGPGNFQTIIHDKAKSTSIKESAAWVLFYAKSIGIRLDASRAAEEIQGKPLESDARIFSDGVKDLDEKLSRYLDAVSAVKGKKRDAPAGSANQKL